MESLPVSWFVGLHGLSSRIMSHRKAVVLNDVLCVFVLLGGGSRKVAPIFFIKCKLFLSDSLQIENKPYLWSTIKHKAMTNSMFNQISNHPVISKLTFFATKDEAFQNLRGDNFFHINGQWTVLSENDPTFMEVINAGLKTEVQIWIENR